MECQPKKTNRTKRLIIIWEMRDKRPREIIERLKSNGCMTQSRSQFWRDLQTVRAVKVEE